MKYIRLYEERLKDFEIMTYPDTKSLIEELVKEIKKDDYDLDYIRDLVTYGHFDIDVIWRDSLNTGWTFLTLASILNKADIVKILLEEGADPNGQDSYDSTALHYASFRGHIQVVQALLSHPKTNPNLQNRWGHTALHFASSWGRSQVVQALLSHPSTNTTLTNKEGKTAWDLATPEIREQFPQLEP
jgi:ankyrin repeat protein